MIKDVTDLEIYKESLTLFKELTVFLKRISKAEFDLINQLKRAAISVPANISEGYARKMSAKEFKRFLIIAMGSSDEVISHLRISTIMFPDLSKNAEDLATKYKKLSKMISRLISVWKDY